MIYTSKRRKFKDFVKTRNWRYYLLFLIIFITLITCVVIITSKNKRNQDSNPSNQDIVNNNNSSSETSENTENIRGKYKLSINTAINQISIYEWDESSNDFKSEPYKYMPTASDMTVEEGEYSFKSDELDKSIWYTSPNGKYYRYCTNFNDTITFHSAEYTKYNDKDSLNTSSYKCIGSQNETKGFILLCSDAKWIYENCSYATEIHVYSDANETPAETQTPVIPVAEGLTWDPTDNSSNSPYCQTEIAEFKCLFNSVDVEPGTNIVKIYNYVTASDINGNNISSYAYTTFSGSFDDIKSYNITFYLADIYGNVLSDNIIINVVEPEIPSSEEENSEESSENPSEGTEENPSEEESDTEEPSSEIPTEEASENSSEDSESMENTIEE